MLMSSRLTKKSVVKVPGRFVKTPKLRSPEVRVQHPQSTHEHRHLRGAQRQALGAFDEEFLGRATVTVTQIVAEPVEGRLQHGEGLDVGVLLRARPCDRA